MHETTRTGATLRDLLDEAEELARREQSNVALTIDGGIHTTGRHRPDQVPTRLAILQYSAHDDAVRLCTFTDHVREAWRKNHNRPAT